MIPRDPMCDNDDCSDETGKWVHTQDCLDGRGKLVVNDREQAAREDGYFRNIPLGGVAL